jgi:hypothetical protein
MEYIYFLFLFGPGLALAFYGLADEKFELFDRILIGLGLSLAFYPVVFLIGYVPGIPINPGVIYLLISFSLLAPGWKLYHLRPSFRVISLRDISPDTWLAWLFLLIILALSLYVRIAIVKDLQIPMWADSYHHTMISQLMIENQGLFNSWFPYAPLQTFTYHFGFHSLVASYTWLTGIASPRSVLVTGQMINFLTVPGCYLLAKQLTGKQWAGNFAALFVGLISMMPAYYVNWGRYTQLTGLAILPCAIVLLIQLLAQPKPSWRLILITALAITGLGLSHYGVLIFFILFGIILVIYHLFQARSDRGRVRQLILTLLQVALIIGIVASPWIWNFIQGQFLKIVTTIVAQAPGADPEKIRAHNSIGDIRFFFNTHWYILVFVGSLWALWRRAWYVMLISIWTISLLILANPDYLKLPGTGLINNFAVFLSLFFPFSVILANLASDLILFAQARARWTIYLTVIGLVALGLWGARFRLSLFEAKNQLVMESDLRAMAWIKENVPMEAKFLINHTYVYNGSTVIGTDAGWWLPLLAQRQNTIPPMAFQEVQTPEAFQAGIFFRQLDKLNLNSFSGYTFLREHEITHIYIGEKREKIGDKVGDSSLEAEKLKSSGLYQEIYQLDHVSILALPDLEPDLGARSAD